MNTLQPVEEIKQIEEGNILMPQGFKASGVHAGLRYSKRTLASFLPMSQHQPRPFIHKMSFKPLQSV